MFKACNVAWDPEFICIPGDLALPFCQQAGLNLSIHDILTAVVFLSDESNCLFKILVMPLKNPPVLSFLRLKEICALLQLFSFLSHHYLLHRCIMYEKLY